MYIHMRINRPINRWKIVIPVIGIFMVILAAMIANYQNSPVTAYPLNNATADYSFGTISSIQNDPNGKPAWILSGHWKSNLASNQSTDEGQDNGTYPGRSFNAQFEMVLFNGTAAHTHTITNFVASNTSQPNNSTITFNGTATASMREGPVTDIPTSTSIMGDKVISIWLDPSKIDNHYGNTPIYGLVMDKPDDRQGQMRFNSTQMR
jgi:hypothetical protein